MYYTFELSLKKLLHYKVENSIVFEKLVLKMQEKFKLAICPAGEMVGIICGQSIGEPTTQMTLNKFHHIGTGSKSNTTTGVPRMKELLAVSKKIKTPSMTLYLKSNIDGNDDYNLDYNTVRDFSMQFEYTKLSDVCKKLDIFCEMQYDPTNPSKTVYEADQEWFNLLNDVEGPDYFEKIKTYPWVVRLELDSIKYNMMGIDFSSIPTLIEENIRKIPAKNKSIISTENFIISHPDNEVIRIYIRINDQMDQNVWLNFYKIVEKIIMNTKLKGIEGISSVSVSETKSKTGKKEFTLYTTGSKVKDTLTFKEKPIVIQLDESRTVEIKLDKSRIKTNDVQEMFDVYGIEMARHMLIEEFQEVLSEAGGVNMRHITILVDTMTSRGNLIPIDRHGVKKNEIGPLSRATFEETVDQLLKAATFGEKDHMNGVSANIMMGQIAPCGTGTVNLLLDEAKILSAKHLLDSYENLPDVEITNIQIETIENVVRIDKEKPLTKKTSPFSLVEPIRWFGNINSRVIIA
jgi:DNA-directed RNA polymerase II subunit RPB1